MKQPSPYQIHNLPLQPTPFIGRANEVAEITALLVDPACRLLTLVGPGGIGKTRLAIQTATEMPDDFADGVYFVPLQSVQSIDFLPTTIVDAIRFSLSGQEDPATQLLNYLGDKEMLLLLDNFEQFLASSQEGEIEGIGILVDLLRVAPKVKLLVTSREVLNLQEEWLYPVHGMSFPDSDQITELEPYNAIQLFNERAHQVRRDFSLTGELADVIRICRLVEGMPLAIELAATWTKTLSCATIAAEIQRSVDFLESGLRNVPDRQRSVRAVFDQSWGFLTEKERDVFKRLAFFRGGFSREAAKWVANASLATLSMLVDKSLLRSEPGGRYNIHELLRQYAAEQLMETPEEVAQVHDFHCAYYADFLYQRHKDIKGGSQAEAAREIAADIENVRAAWQWATQQTKLAELKKAADTLFYFFQFQSWFLEGLNTFEKAAQGLSQAAPTPERDRIRAEILICEGWFRIRLGQLQKAKAVFEESQAIYSNFNFSPRPEITSDPLTGLGTLANVLGNYAQAEKLGEESRHRNELNQDKANLLDSFYVLTNATFAQGKYQLAQQYAQQAYALSNEIGDRWMMAYILSDLGNVARALGDYAQAKQHYQASYSIRDEFNDSEGMAVALNHLGEISWLQADYQEAERLYRQSLAIYREIGDKGGLAAALKGLGDTACVMGEFQQAQRYLHEALQITTEIQFVPLTLAILIGIGDLLLRTGQQEQGIALLALSRHHPASDRETRDRAQQCLDHYQAEVTPKLFAGAMEQGEADDLEAIVTALQVEFGPLIEAEVQWGKEAGAKEISPAPRSPGVSALIEPLTSRELEVLQLIADGLTNQQIAAELIISIGTAKWYTGQIYSKLEVSNRTQAVARARELDLLS